MNKSKIILIIIIILFLIASNIYFAFQYFSVREELRQAQAILEVQIINEKVLSFTKLFIAEVLKAEAEVDFETRLRLETTVRDLNDQEILSQWQRFTESRTEAEAQTEVKKLLEMLMGKIGVH
jgi:flagellar basal body-associated protein FliL